MKAVKRVGIWGFLLLLQGCITGGGGTGGDGLTGVIVDAQGQPVAGASVGAYALDGGHKSVVTDDSGRFKIPGLKAGAYNLVASHSSSGNTTALFVPGIQFSEHVDLGSRELKPSGNLQIAVVGQTGGVAVGVKCEVPASPYVALTGENGVCALADMAPGVYRARVIRSESDTVITDSVEVLSYVTQGLSVFGISRGPGLGGNWSIRSYGVHSDLRAVTWAGNRYVAVGDSGMILTSPDGLVWSATRLNNPDLRLQGIAWTGTTLVAVGRGQGDSGVIYSSANGVLWTLRAKVPHSLNAVALGGTDTTRIVAVGEGGAVLTSLDGSVWTPTASATSTGLSSVAWIGTKFLAVGKGYRPMADHGVILSSENGVAWSLQADSSSSGSPAHAASLIHVSWTGNQAVLVGGYGGIWLSSDGSTWLEGIWGSPLFASAWTGERLVSIGHFSANNSGGIWTHEVAEHGPTRVNRFALPEFVYPQAIVSRPGVQLVVVGDNGLILTSP